MRNVIKEKIFDIVSDHVMAIDLCNEVTDELCNLCNASDQKGIILDFIEKLNYSQGTIQINKDIVDDYLNGNL